MDDQLWAQTMSTDRLLTERRVDRIHANESLHMEEHGLVRLLSLGILDHSARIDLGMYPLGPCDTRLPPALGCDVVSQ